MVPKVSVRRRLGCIDPSCLRGCLFICLCVFVSASVYLPVCVCLCISVCRCYSLCIYVSVRLVVGFVENKFERITRVTNQFLISDSTANNLCMSVYLSIYPSVCLPVCLSVSLVETIIRHLLTRKGAVE